MFGEYKHPRKPLVRDACGNTDVNSEQRANESKLRLDDVLFGEYTPPKKTLITDARAKKTLITAAIPLLQGYTETVLKAAAYAKHTETRF